MKNFRLVAVAFLLFCATLTTFAQDEKFGLEISYPLTVGGNFLQENYSGVADIGLQYSLYKSGNLEVSPAFNLTYLAGNGRVINQIRVQSFILNPKVQASYRLGKLTPSLSLGYASFNFSFKPVVNGQTGDRQTAGQGGVNGNIGLAYHFNERLYFKAQLDYYSLSAENDVPDTAFNTDLTIAKFGLGIRL